jgi:guanylate kinase
MKFPEHKIVLIVGPSAIGKSFMAQTLMGMFPDLFLRVHVYTTRQKRGSESEVTDRIFVSKDEFKDMVKQQRFCVYKHFAGNWYGYHKNEFESIQKHLIVDLPPFFLPDFLKYKNVIIVGLQAPPYHEAFLNQRMQSRGDSPQVRQARTPFIQRDIQDLAALSALVNKHGKTFQIENNQTIPDTVIPWVIRRLRNTTTAATTSPGSSSSEQRNRAP